MFSEVFKTLPPGHIAWKLREVAQPPVFILPVLVFDLFHFCDPIVPVTPYLGDNTPEVLAGSSGKTPSPFFRVFRCNS